MIITHNNSLCETTLKNGYNSGLGTEVDIIIRTGVCVDLHAYTIRYAGLQLRKNEQNGFYDNFLISQPNPMM